MKLGDRRKVAMHRTPKCGERSRLHVEMSTRLSEYLACMDDTKQTPKDDPLYPVRLRDMKVAKAKYKAAESHYSQHVAAHGCWRGNPLMGG